MTSRARSPLATGPVKTLGVLSKLAALVATVATGLAGCGDDPIATDDFVGTWHYEEVKSSIQCPDGDPFDQPPLANKTFARGVDASLVDLSLSALDDLVFCNFGYDVAGPVATIKRGQTCVLTGGDTFTIDDPTTGGPPLWTFTLNSATTAEELGSATIHLSVVTPLDTACSWSFVGHLKRVSKD
jgi:hypothetical protein